MKKRRFVFPVVLIIALIMACSAIFGLTIPFGIYIFHFPGAQDIRLGIDIRGGVDAVYEPTGLDRKPTASELEAARSIIETRLDKNNILDYEVTIDETNGYVLVRFPWKTGETAFDPQSALAELGETAMLTFRDAQGTVLVEGRHVENSAVKTDPNTGEIMVGLKFNSEGTMLFSDATKRLVGQRINIFMDDTLIQSATVEEHIAGGEAVINNMKSAEEAKALADKINSGALPFSMVTKNHSIISPTLGANALNIMLEAGVIAFGLICVLLIVYYRMSGFVACISLLIQISGQVLVLSLTQITLTITGIAGIILSIGMGVDANVIISERISDELRSGKTLRASITSGFKNAFSSVFDGNITVLIVAVILMSLGSGALLSFAYSLLIGILFNFIAGVTASRLMIRSLSDYKVFNRPRLYTSLSKGVSL